MPKNGCFSSRRFHGIQDKKKRKEVATTMSLFPLIKKRKKKAFLRSFYLEVNGHP